MKIVLAGGTGFIGRCLAAALIAKGHQVVFLTRGTVKPPQGKGGEWRLCDVTQFPFPANALQECDAIINLVGIIREVGTHTFERIHIGAVKNLIAAAREIGIRRFIHVGVSGSRPSPDNAYLDTKWRAEQIVRESGLDFTILRPGVVFGPGDQIISNLIRILRYVPVFLVPGSGKSIMQVVYVEDVAAAGVAALEQTASIGKSYDLFGPEQLTFREIITRVAKGISRPVWIVPTPPFVERVAARIMEWLLPDPILTRFQLELLIEGVYGDSELARQDLNIQFTPLTTEIIARMWQQLFRAKSPASMNQSDHTA